MGRKRNSNMGENIEKSGENTLSSRLSELISDAGELANYLGCSTAAVNQYRLGTSRPSLENIRKIALFYHTSTDYLLGLPWGAKDINSDIRNAMEYTGLSEKALEKLHSCLALGEVVGKDFLSELIMSVRIGVLGTSLINASSMTKDHVTSLIANGQTDPESPNYGTFAITSLTADGRMILSTWDALCFTRFQIKEELNSAVDKALSPYYEPLRKKINSAREGEDNAVNQKDGN